MPARRGQPGPPRPNNGRPPAIVEKVARAVEQLSHWLGSEGRAARLTMADLRELERLASKLTLLCTMELQRRADQDDARLTALETPRDAAEGD